MTQKLRQKNKRQLNSMWNFTKAQIQSSYSSLLAGHKILGTVNQELLIDRRKNKEM